MGADYRKIGVYLLNPGNAAGSFQFDKEFTSSTGLNQNSTTEGDAFASFLLGYPTADGGAPEHDDADDAARHLHQLLQRLLAGRLARRARSSRSTTACASSTRTASVKWTTTSRSASIRRPPARSSSVIIPGSGRSDAARPPRGRVTGGLMFAGVERQQELPGQPAEA